MTALKSNLVQARKPHRCYWCGEKIKRGEEYIHVAGVEDGEFYHTDLHTECDKAWLREDRSPMGNGEITPYENPRGLTWYEEEEMDMP